MVGKFFFHWSSSRGTKQPAVGKQPVQGVQAGIVREYEDGSFRPDAPITRAEMAEMVARALKLPIGEKASTGCADDHAIPQWAKSAVRRFATWAWSAGGNNEFAPHDTASRAEAVVIMLRMPEAREQA